MARPGLRPDALHSGCGAAFLASSSLDGGFEELRESAASRRFNLLRLRRDRRGLMETSCFNSTTSAASSSYEGYEIGRAHV